MSPLKRGLAVGVVVALGACGGGSGVDSPGAGEWRSETTTEGDVTTVRTTSGSVWGGTATLREELSIGVEAGDDAYMFGQIRGIAAHDGEIFALDQQIPAIRVYDRAGAHVRDIGKDGDGPGEFRRPESMVISPDGRLFVRDPRTGRITIFSTTGETLGTMPLVTGFSTSGPMVITHDGTLYNQQLLNRGADVADWQMGMVPRFAAAEGEPTEGEPIAPPDFDFEPWSIEGRSENSSTVNRVPFSPSVSWTLSPSGAIIAGLSTDYAFEIRYPDGRTTRVERVWAPVPVDPDEADWYRKRATANMQSMFPGWTWNGREVPATKPAFSSLVADHSGRIWVRRSGRGERVEGACVDTPTPEDARDAYEQPCWRETTLWDVFDEEGRFLGGAELIEGVQTSPTPYVRDDLFLSSFIDDAGTILIKQFRIEIPAS